jgi:hypothetical protein
MMTAELSGYDFFHMLNDLCNQTSSALIATLPLDIDQRQRAQCLQEYELGRAFADSVLEL